MQREGDQGRNAADFETARSEVADRLDQEMRSAREALHDAGDDLTRKAGDYAAETKQVLFDKAQGAQRDISANLKAISGAMRAASEHLANNEQRTASKLALDAAGGLERLSSSLKDKPFQDVLGEVRSFGRNNSGALFASSVLAGLALARFLKSSPPSGSKSPDKPAATAGAKSPAMTESVAPSGESARRGMGQSGGSSRGTTDTSAGGNP